MLLTEPAGTTRDTRLIYLRDRGAKGSLSYLPGGGVGGGRSGGAGRGSARQGFRGTQEESEIECAVGGSERERG